MARRSSSTGSACGRARTAPASAGGAGAAGAAGGAGRQQSHTIIESPCLGKCMHSDSIIPAGAAGGPGDVEGAAAEAGAAATGECCLSSGASSKACFRAPARPMMVVVADGLCRNMNTWLILMRRHSQEQSVGLGVSRRTNEEMNRISVTASHKLINICCSSSICGRWCTCFVRWCREWGCIPTIVFDTSFASTCRSSVPRSCPASNG
jgi:hypothetical protein